MLALPVNVDRKRKILARLEEIQLLFQEERVGAEINVFLTLDKPGDDFADLRMHERLATGNRDHGRATLLYRLEAFLRRKVLLQDVRWILDLAAAGAGEVATEQGFQHEDEGVALASRKLLLQDVGCDRPHL